MPGGSVGRRHTAGGHHSADKQPEHSRLQLVHCLHIYPSLLSPQTARRLNMSTTLRTRRKVSKTRDDAGFYSAQNADWGYEALDAVVRKSDSAVTRSSWQRCTTVYLLTSATSRFLHYFTYDTGLNDVIVHKRICETIKLLKYISFFYYTHIHT